MISLFNLQTFDDIELKNPSDILFWPVLFLDTLGPGKRTDSEGEDSVSTLLLHK